MSRYYCSGYDTSNAFGHGIGKMFKKELKDTKSIVYIPGGMEKIQKSIDKYIPLFAEHFKNVGITFDETILITDEFTPDQAKKAVREASMVMLMGGDPFSQKKLCEKLDILEEIKNYTGVLVGFSAGAMLMSKYIIITPCSEEYPDFHIEEGLNLDGISIYPHNNTNKTEYPKELVNDDEIYQRDDLIKVAKEYGDYYLLQDYYREDEKVDISYIKSNNNTLKLYTENDGKLWIAKKDGIFLTNKI